MILVGFIAPFLGGQGFLRLGETSVRDSVCHQLVWQCVVVCGMFDLRFPSFLTVQKKEMLDGA